jgi:diguanylate cyclase (GGDEF)-like protein
MADQTKPLWPRFVSACRRAALRPIAAARTIRGRMFVAFLVMGTITAALGGYATLGVRDAGILVNKTYDESLMSINYARAAAADFAAMRAAFARRWIATDAATRKELDEEIKKLSKSLTEDLGIAARRSQSARARRAANNVLSAAKAWKSTSEHLIDGTKLDATWDTLDEFAKKVDEQIDLLVNYTAGDGFIYRESARAAVARDINLNIAGTLIALTMSGLVAWGLARRIIKPVAAASNVAECIATGKLDVTIPDGSADELGALLGSMRSMRDNIRAMMESEVEQRRSAQARLADALENSQEGVVLVDAEDCIALANAQAANFLGVPLETLKPGQALIELQPMRDGTADKSWTPLRRDGDLVSTGEVQLADGRWLRTSQSATRDGGFMVVYSDISLSKSQEATLRLTNLRLDAALDNMSQGLCLFDAENRLEVVNRRFFEIFELSRRKVRPGCTFRQILELGKAKRDNDKKTVAQLLEEQAEHMRRHETGTHYYELNGRVIASVYNPTSNGGWVATFEDVTERRQAEAKIMHMARHDALTDLPNRVLFRHKMEQALTQDEKFAVLFIDLDRFKGVNDTLGHPIGDRLLCAVTQRLQTAVRGSDTVARLGGDEFAIVQIDVKPTEAAELAGRIIEALSEPFEIFGNHVIIGASVGIAMAPTDGNEPDHLLRNADMALYEAKSNGRGTYHFFQAEMDAQMQARHTLELDLRKALAAGEFELYYQPIVDVGSNEIAGFEALLRWNHPQRGVVSPDEFISVVEEIGMIGSLGDWVLKSACREAASWPEKLTIAVNLSAVQFRSSALALTVASALAMSGLEADRLELEITESVLLQDDRSVLDLLHQIRGLGVRISMDDFGTGYSSLSYLRSFPFDKIKIDRSFVHELGKKDDCIAIIRAVTRLGNNLGMTTIAEGVETEEQLKILRAEGCTQVQGYLFSRPKPAAAIPTLIREIKAQGRAA